MTTVEEVICKAKDFADAAGKKTGELVSLTKLKFEAAEVSRTITMKMEKIGRIVYESRQSGENCDATLEALFADVAELEEKADTLAEKIDDLRRTKTCVSCGKNNRSDAAFCQNCGEKL